MTSRRFFRKPAAPLPVLPIEILLEEILPRLPVKSLLRFKCVNKLFRTVISSQKFIKLHLHQSNTNRFLIVADNNEADRFRTLYSMDLDFQYTTRLVEFPFSLNYSKSLGTTWLVGSCNGLLCFRNTCAFNELVFSNPATRMFKRGIPLEHHFAAIGFGYDSINDDYKVVIYIDCQIMVYSMRLDVWRCIEKPYAKDLVYAYDHPLCGVLLNNHLVHWMFRCVSDDDSHNQDHRQLGCFNLETEQWMADVPLPQYKFFDCLRVINGCLGLFTKDETQCYLWIMKEYGVKESWVKVIVSENSFRATYLLHTMVSAYRKETRKDELLVKVQRNRVYYWHNKKSLTYDIDDKFFWIPPDYNVLMSTIASLVTIV